LRFRNFFMFTMTLVLAACSSPRLRVQSEPPGAQVFIGPAGAKDRVLLGTTPFEMPYADVYSKTHTVQESGEYLTLVFEGKDQEPEQLLVPSAVFGAKLVNVRAKLTAKKDAKFASMILQYLHNAQKFAHSGEFERAQIEADHALEIDPKFARSLSMKGSLYYMQKNYDEAIKWYEKALASDNSFSDAVKMIARIKQERK